MKKIFITTLVICTLVVNVALAKSFIDEVSDAVGTSPTVNINLGTGIIKTILAFSNDSEAKEARKIMAGLNKIRVSVFEFDDDSKVNKLTKIINKKVSDLTDQGYEKLISIKSEDENVQILAKVNNQFLQDAMIVVMEEDELVIISLDGEVDLQQLAEISDHFDVDIEDVLDI